MDIDARYSYNPIQHNELRLLKFLPDDTHTSAVLETFSVEEPLPRYHALSYTWASDTLGLARTWAVQIKKQELPVLESLRPFVKALRSKGMLSDGSWWWIDSICIDQANLEERAQQVQLMQLVYRRAHQVIVWLGEESSDSNLAIDFIESLDKIFQQNYTVGEIRMMLENDHHNLQWVALTNFLGRRWWSRIWTVQEFVIPASISFWCGMRSISRIAVCRSLSIADKCTSIGIKETLAFRYGFNRRRAWDLYNAGKAPGAKPCLSLLALAAYFCCMDATDDRDRLYGLRALSTDGSLLDVDYSLRSEEVYLRFTQAFITRHKSLDIICFASIYSAPTGSLQPSWVPYWHKRNAFLVIPLMVSQSSNTHIGNLRSPKFLERDTSICYSVSKNRAAMHEFQGSALLAHGVVIDEVDGLAGSSTSELVQSSEWNSMHSDSACSPPKLLLSVCRSLVLDRKDRFLRYGMPIEFLQDFVHLCASLIIESHISAPKELEEWFHWTRDLQIHGQSFESILCDGYQADIDSPSSAPNQDEFIHDSFFGRFFDTVVRMSLRLMTSRNGRLGMVPPKAAKGDLVCVLFGCSVPVLLRKFDHEDSFTLIGECFLDGCMDGSVPGRDELLEKRFCIR